MRHFAQIFRSQKQRSGDHSAHADTVARIKAEASHNTTLVNNSLKVLRTTKSLSEKRTHLQILKERISTVKVLTQKHDFLKVSPESMKKVENEIFRVERELHHKNSSGLTHIPNPKQLISQIKKLKEEGRYIEAGKLLMHCIDVSEKVTAGAFGIAPWYYEQLSEIFRIQKEYAKEVAILEKYLRNDKSPSKSRSALYRQLDEARRFQETFGNKGEVS